MDNKLDRYRRIIKQILLQHAELVPSHGEIEVRPVFDPANDSYLLVDSGWDRTRRVHTAIIDLRVKEGKVWIEADGTERGIAYELLDAGVPQSDMVLGYMHPSRRELVVFDLDHS